MSSAVRYQVMPPLSSDEYQELYESIKAEGVHEPIHVDEEGVVIDGHHRSKIASELGIPCPVITHDDLNEAGKRSLAFTLNLKRRHLNREQRRELIAESLKSDPQLSNREHARRTGAHQTTVGTVRNEMEDRGEVSKLDTSIGSDGKSYPASQPKREVTATPAAGFNTDDLNELNAEEEVRPVFQSAQEPEPRRHITPPRRSAQIDRELEAKARAKSSAPDSGPTVTAENAADRNVKRFDALAIARKISKDLNELAGILSHIGGIRGMEAHLEDIRTALNVSIAANNGSGLDADLNNLLNGSE